MNERIKELLTPKLKEWAGDSDDNFSEELEKFAELIIQECAELVETQHTWITSVAASALVRKHFGVE
jgi:hypothetical protein